MRLYALLFINYYLSVLVTACMCLYVPVCACMCLYVLVWPGAEMHQRGGPAEGRVVTKADGWDGT